MADTPTDDGSESAPARRTRKPRAAAHASDASSADKPARKPRGRKPAQPPSAGERVKRTARVATRNAEAAAGKATRTVKSAARNVAKPGTAKRTVIGVAAVAGVAAGVAAAVFGRKKIAKATGDVIDTVTGTVANLADTDRSAPDVKPSAD